MPNQYTSVGRSVAYSLRFTEGEWSDLEARAKGRGVPIADIIRDALGFREPEAMNARLERAEGDRDK